MHRNNIAIGVILSLCLTAIVAGCTQEPNSITAPPATAPTTQIPAPVTETKPEQPSIVNQEVSVRSIEPGHWQIGPVVTDNTQGIVGYAWHSDSSLLFSSDNASASLIDLDRGMVVASSLINRPDLISQDRARVAFMREQTLVVRAIDGSTEKTWDIGDAENLANVRSLVWSPNGDYLLGTCGDNSEKAAVTNIWVLDWRSGTIAKLYKGDDRSIWYSSVQWSPNGQQAVVGGAQPRWGGKREFVLVDIPARSSKVIVPASREHVDIDFSWDASGKLLVTKHLPGPEMSRPVGYDPVLKRYQDQMANEDSDLLPTELHFITYERQLVDKVDLKSALQEARMAVTDGIFGYMRAEMDPSGQYAVLHGSMGSDSFLGLLDMKTRLVTIERTGRYPDNAAVFIGDPWVGSTVYYRMVGDLVAWDVQSNKRSTLMSGAELISAQRLGESILYVGKREFGVLTLEGVKRTLVTVGSGEQLSWDIKLSPSKSRVAIMRWSANPTGYTHTVEVVDLKDRVKPE